MSLKTPPGIYLLAILAMSILAVGAILALTLFRPGQDNNPTFLLIVATIAPTTAALLALLKGTEAAEAGKMAALKGEENANALKEVEIKIDGRLSQLLRQTALAEGAAGREAGRADAVAEQTAAVASDIAAAIAARTTEAVTARTAEEVAARVGTIVTQKLHEIIGAASPSVDPQTAPENGPAGEQGVEA